MTNRLVSMLALAALSGGTLLAQDIAGAWQGTLKLPAQDLRTILQISRGPDETLKAVFYSIDQTPMPFNANSVTLKGSSLKITINQFNGTFEGTLSSDRNSISGTWSQGGPALPLNLVKPTPETAWAIPDPPPPPKVMKADAELGFEVATIKPSRPEETFSLAIGRGGANTLSTTSTPLRTLIQFANGIHPAQVLNLPSWGDSEKYDVTIKPDQEGLPSIAQARVIVGKVLADRFRLVSHKEKKELPVYAITVWKDMPKLDVHEGPASNLPGFGMQRGSLIIRNSTIAEFAGFLQANIMERPVVDQTGLKDRFDFTVKYTPDASQVLPNFPNGMPGPAPASAADAPPDLFTAFQQQLGLKLESTKASVDVVIVDKVEKPSDN